MKVVAENIKHTVRTAAFLVSVPVLSLLLLYSDRRASAEHTKIRGAWLSLWARVWERVNDLTERKRVDTAVLFSSFIFSTTIITLLFDPYYLERYPIFTLMRTYAGGYPFWLAATGLIAFAQFITAFCYGMRDVRQKAWEFAVVVTTGLAAALLMIMHNLMAHEVESILSRIFFGLCMGNAWYAVSFGFARAVDRDRTRLAPLMVRRGGRWLRPTLTLTGRATPHPSLLESKP